MEQAIGLLEDESKMLICEVISESQDEVLNDLEEIVTRALANRKSKISSQMTLAKLHNMGYSISMDAMIDLLKTITTVAGANQDTITLDIALPHSKADPQDDTVSKMAAKQLKKDMK